MLFQTKQRKHFLSLLKENSNEESSLTTFLNPYSYLIARKHVELFSKYNIYMDGIIFVILARLFRISNQSRKSFDMTSIATEVFEDAVQKRKKLYIIGTHPQVIDRAVLNIRFLYPNIKICGFRDGYFQNSNQRDQCIQLICQQQPDLVVCGMGTPLQEKFLADLKKYGWKGAGYTCGGFLHQIASKTKYYPDWINKYNLRWLYRIIDEPKLLKRYLWHYPKAVIYFIFDFIAFNYQSDS